MENRLMKSLSGKILQLCFYAILTMIIPCIEAAELSNESISIKSNKTIIDSISYNGKTYLYAGGVLTQNKNGSAYMNRGVTGSVTLTSEGDTPLLLISGKNSFEGQGDVVKYEIKTKLSAGDKAEIEVNGEFLQEFQGEFSFIAWMPFKIFKGCPVEFKYGDNWAKKTMSENNEKNMDSSRCNAARLILSDRHLLLNPEKGFVRFCRWITDNKEQPFRLEIFPEKPSSRYQPGDKFQIKLSVQFISAATVDNNENKSRDNFEISLYPSSDAASAQPLLNLDMEKFKNLDFVGLTGLVVYSDEGKRLETQIEDQNFNGKIDQSDLLIVQATQSNGRWQALKIVPEYKGTVAAVFRRMEKTQYDENGFFFEKKGNNDFILGFSPAERVSFKPGDSTMTPPLATGAEELNDGLYITKGPLRCRIDLISRNKHGVPVIQSFAFNSKDKTITYSINEKAFCGWSKQFIKIKPLNNNAEKYSNICGYSHGNLVYGSTSDTKPMGIYGNWLCGKYDPVSGRGVSAGVLNESQNISSWAPMARADKDMLVFYTPIAGSFTGKVELSFAADKADFEKAFSRCKATWSMEIGKSANVLNLKLQQDHNNINAMEADILKTSGRIGALNQKGLFTAAAANKLDTARIWLAAAQEDKKTGQITEAAKRLNTAGEYLKKAISLLDEVERIKLSLPSGSASSPMIIGVCDGSLALISQFDFDHIFLDAARYAPLKIAGIEHIQYHSFDWADAGRTNWKESPPIKKSVEWIRLMNKLGLNAYPQMGLARVPEFVKQDYPWCTERQKGWEWDRIGRVSPGLTGNYKNTKEFIALTQEYHKTAGMELARQKGIGGIIGINEPVPIFYCDGRMKDVFLYGLRNYLQERYNNIAALNSAWESNYGSFEHVDWKNDWLSEKADNVKLHDGWTFCIDKDNAGEKNNWQSNPPTEQRAIKVPGYWEKQFPEYSSYNGIAWYFRKITVPSGTHLLCFDGIDDNAVVYLNGKQVAANTGYNVPFKIEINGPLTEALLAVKVEDKLMDGGIWKPVYMSRENKSPYRSAYRYPARVRDYYDYRNLVNADFVGIQLDGLKAGTESLFVTAKEWTSDLSFPHMSTKCDPFYVNRHNRGYTGWDIYTHDPELLAFMADLRQSTGNGKPSILGELGLHTIEGSPLGSGAVQDAPGMIPRLFGRNLRGVFFFSYFNQDVCSILKRDRAVSDALLRMGELNIWTKNMGNVFDSLLPAPEIGLYFSRNDVYMSEPNMVHNQLRSLHQLFYRKNINVTFVDSTLLSSISGKLKMLVVPSSPFISREEWAGIEKFYQSGGGLLIYSNTGFMAENNQERTVPLLTGVQFNGFKSDSFGGTSLDRNCAFGMRFNQSFKTVLATEKGNPLIVAGAPRFYISNADVARLLNECNSNGAAQIWNCIEMMMLESNAIPPVETSITGREVQLLKNRNNDVFLYVSPGKTDIAGEKIMIAPKRLSEPVKGTKLYDYLNLLPASLAGDNGRIILCIPKLEKNQQAVWYIGKSI